MLDTVLVVNFLLILRLMTRRQQHQQKFSEGMKLLAVKLCVCTMFPFIKNAKKIRKKKTKVKEEVTHAKLLSNKQFISFVHNDIHSAVN